MHSQIYISEKDLSLVFFVRITIVRINLVTVLNL